MRCCSTHAGLACLASAALACSGNGSTRGSSEPAPTEEFPEIALTPGRAEYAFSHEGLPRRFLVYLPDGYAAGLPMMVALHAGGGRAKQMFDQHPLEMYADELGYVMVAPQGTPNGQPNSFEWNAQAARYGSHVA